MSLMKTIAAACLLAAGPAPALADATLKAAFNISPQAES